MLFTEAKDRAPALQWCVAASTWPARPPPRHWCRLGNLLLRIHSKSLRVNNSLPAPAKRKSINGQARRETTCLLRFGLRGGGGTRGAPMPATASPRADLGEEPQLCRPVRPPAVYNCFSSRRAGGWGSNRRAGSRNQGNHDGL